MSAEKSQIIRLSRPEDQEGIQQVRKKSWEAAYKNLLPADLIAEATQPKASRRVFQTLPDEIMQSRISFLAEDNQHNILGFVAGGLLR
jgi:hypothetical protein